MKQVIHQPVLQCLFTCQGFTLSQNIFISDKYFNELEMKYISINKEACYFTKANPRLMFPLPKNKF